MANSTDTTTWSKRSWAALDFSAGKALDRKEVNALRRILKDDPTDVTARILLMGAYWDNARLPKHKHYKKGLQDLLWLIDNFPWYDQHDEIGMYWDGCSYVWHIQRDLQDPRVMFQGQDILKNDYAIIDSHWREALNQYPGHREVLKNAAQFFRWSSPSTADELYTQIECLEPDSRFVRREVAHRNGDEDWWKT